MKKLSDYKDDEAIDLWADLLDPLQKILSDENIKKVILSGKSKMEIAKTILKEHKSDAVTIMTRIDPEPIDGLNIILRLMTVLSEIGESEEIRSFFGYAEAVKVANASSGSATENIKVGEN